MAPLPLVRLAQPEDEPELLAMCQRLHKENGMFPLNLEKVRAIIQRSFQHSWPAIIVGVVGSPGKIEASTCLEVTTFYYSDKPHLAELWNFVDQEYRRSHNAEALIQFGKSCAEQLKMEFFTGIITNRQMAGKVRLYRRSLGYPTGAFFVYNSTWQTEPMEDHSDLRTRLKENAHLCATSRMTRRQDIVQLSSLLREAADAIDSADNLWGTKASKSNATSAA